MTKQNEKDAKRVPELRFKGFTDDWEQRKLGEIATIVGGGTPSTKNPEYWDGDINWYSPAEIGNQIYTEKSERQITELGLKKSSAKLLPVGTVLFTSRAGIGKTAILNKEACTNQGFQSIIPRSKMLNSYFLFSRTNSLKQYGETMGSGSTFVEVSGKQMSKMPLFIPNINEQSKIAKLFQSLDKTITLHEEKQRQLELLNKALLQKMFADETGYPILRFKGFSNAWKQRKLGEVSSLRGRIGFRGYKQTDLVEKGKGAITFSPSDIYANGNISFLNNKYISIKKYEESPEIQVNTGDILFTKTASIGKIGYVRKLNEKATINPQIALLTPKLDFNGYFIFLSIRNDAFMRKVLKIVGGSSVPTMSQEKLKNLTINFPSSIEQHKLATIFLKIDNLITLHQHKIDNLKRLKRALLQKMFV